MPFKRSVSSSERGLPLISRSNPDKVVGMSEVNLGIDSGLPRTVQEVRDEGKGVAVLPSDLIQTSVVDTETKRTVFLLDEEYWSSARRIGRSDEAGAKILVDVFSESVEL